MWGKIHEIHGVSLPTSLSGKGPGPSRPSTQPRERTLCRKSGWEVPDVLLSPAAHPSARVDFQSRVQVHLKPCVATEGNPGNDPPLYKICSGSFLHLIRCMVPCGSLQWE